MDGKTYTHVVKRLVDRGLVVNLSLPPIFAIYKPTWTVGNFRTVKMDIWLNDYIDEPISLISFTERGWLFRVRIYEPGPGPGDFDLYFQDIDDCLDNVLDYYFGDSKRMSSEGLN